MRKSCACCARKHIAQAHILLTEHHMGYPLHGWLAVGHLAEAEDETLLEWPGVAESIRETRLLVMDCLNAGQRVIVDLLPFIEQLTVLYHQSESQTDS